MSQSNFAITHWLADVCMLWILWRYIARSFNP